MIPTNKTETQREDWKLSGTNSSIHGQPSEESLPAAAAASIDAATLIASLHHSIGWLNFSTLSYRIQSNPIDLLSFA